jgi:hypothetical protein
MPEVYSKRSGGRRPPRDAILVARPTIYGNPFAIGVHGDRDEVIEKYRDWIYSPAQAFLRAQIKRDLKGKDLICWCSPLPCHADILLEIANG